LSDVCIYCVVQVVAGICGALSYGMLHWKIFVLAPSEGHGWFAAGLAEVIYTFMLCFVVLNCAASTRNGCDTGQQFFGLAIGCVIVAGGYGAGAISGGCFNPAVAIAIDVSGAATRFGWCLAYTCFELIGAALAAIVFRGCRPEDFTDVSEDSLAVKCVSEFVGTFLLVVTVGLNVLADSPAAAWSIAAALMSMVFSVGDISGAHFNPAVTVTILLSGRNKIDAKAAAAYIASQLCGGVAGAFTYAMIYRGKTFDLGPVAPYPWAAACTGEFMFTFVLCTVVLSVATVENPLSHYFGFAIGMCITTGGCAIGGVSGGSLNPAVSLGISSAALLNGGKFWPCLVYSAVELLGGVLAMGIFRITRPSEYKIKEPPKPQCTADLW